MNGMDTRTSVDELKRQHPIQEVAPRFVKGLRHTGANLIGRCPFHDDRHPSFAVHLSTETWRCYAASCGVGGDVIDLVGVAHFGRAWNSRDPAMFKESLRRLAGGELPPLRQAIPPVWRNLAQWRPEALQPAHQVVLHTAARIYHTSLLILGRAPGTPYAYLRGRGFTDETIRAEALGYAAGNLLGPGLAACGLSRTRAAALNLLNPERRSREFLAGRIIFVDRDRSGRVLHLIGRAYAPWLSSGTPKYLSLKEMLKPLYGYARLDRRESDRPVLLVESPPDALTARQWGYDALAVTGSHLKEDHAVLLGRLRRPLVMIPHNDGGSGEQAAARWREQVGQGVLVCLPDDVKDLNELGVQPGGVDELESRLRAAGIRAEPRSGRGG